jgi:anti-sigma factor ChrR (cupin superfamily)
MARATSVVRYAPGSCFSAHSHPLGEEFLVLDGVFADEHGSYPAGTYVRNPPGSRHAPHTTPGCTILVKLRQMEASEQRRVVIDTAAGGWVAGDVSGHTRLMLHVAPPAPGQARTGNAEQVTLERLYAGVLLAETACPGGEEIFVLSGALVDQHGTYGAGMWIRNPAGHRHRLMTAQGAVYWSKRGHLPPHHAVAAHAEDRTQATAEDR